LVGRADEREGIENLAKIVGSMGEWSSYGGVVDIPEITARLLGIKQYVIGGLWLPPTAEGGERIFYLAKSGRGDFLATAQIPNTSSPVTAGVVAGLRDRWVQA